MPSTDLLISFRGALREYAENIPSMVWTSLILFFAIFLLRLLLRSDWLAGAVFTALFVGVDMNGKAAASDLIFTALVYGTFAFVAIRFGLLSVAAIILLDSTLGDNPASFDSSAWYYPWFVLMALCCAAAIVWAFLQSIRRESPERRAS